ncbi:hypothetical protein KI387_019093, partial [Taxus chinensis]
MKHNIRHEFLNFADRREVRIDKIKLCLELKPRNPVSAGEKILNGMNALAIKPESFDVRSFSKWKITISDYGRPLNILRINRERSSKTITNPVQQRLDHLKGFLATFSNKVTCNFDRNRSDNKSVQPYIIPTFLSTWGSRRTKKDLFLGSNAAAFLSRIFHATSSKHRGTRFLSIYMLAFIETNTSSVLYSSVFEFDLAFMGVSSSSFQRNVEEHALSAIGHQGFSQTPKVFHVFINHRGPDVKKTLALRLYNSLENAGIRAFLDTKEIELGDSIPSAIRNAIFSASIHIAIFSKGYAESAWCLAELDLMLQSKSIIIPVFYDVAPSDLRYFKKGVYADSFAKHKAKGRHLDKLDNWKQTLHSVSLISGYEFSHHNRDFERLCKNVVCAVQREVEKTRVIETAKNPVGINDLVKDFERNCLEKMKNKEKIVGIYGMGGSGKTTLARELFNRKRLEYNSSCFLFDVREASANGNLTSLQSKLLKDLLQGDRKFHSIPEGSSYLRSCLGSCRSVKFLIFLDDIDHERQLHDFLVRDIVQNNSDNVIIVTTRDERVLIRAGITHRYKMKEMNVSHSTELFCWHAFHQPYPVNGYEDFVEMFVKECVGLPLSLQVLGGHVFGSNSRHYWKLELDKVRKTLPKDIKQRLRISIDALDTEQKQILMDIV